MTNTGESRAHSALRRAVARLEHDPADCVFRNVSRLARVVAARFDEALAPAQLTASQFNLLMTVARLGPVSTGALAGRLSMDPSTVPRVIAPLARAGWVRVSAGADRRFRLIEVTDRGARTLQAALPQWHRLQQTLVRALGRPGWQPLRKSISRLRRTVQS